MDASKYLKADFLDILFEGRNKAYGAYDLRLHYSKRMNRAMGLMILLCIVSFSLFAYANYRKAHTPVVKEAPIQKDVVLEQVDVDPDLPPPPPPPPAPEPPKLKAQVQYTPPKVVKDEMVQPDEAPPDLSKIEDKAISTVTKAGDADGIDPGLVQESGGQGVVDAAPKTEEKKVFTFVEQMPSFPGGEGELLKYLSKHINYPAMARENGIQGTVVVQFVVNTDGSIVDVATVGQKRGGGLEEEAMRVVNGMPKWTAGKQNGRPVRVQYSLPVRFQLQ